MPALAPRGAANPDRHMPFKYSCFISYAGFPTPGNKLAGTFIKELYDALRYETQIRIGLDPFLDTERMQAGDFFADKLAQSLCASVCMVCVYTPVYFQKLYCAKEFLAMERLETRRRELLKSYTYAGGILPVILRGEGERGEDPPTYLRENRHCSDFARYTLGEASLARHRKYNGKITEIALVIWNLHNQLLSAGADRCVDCETFQLPSDQEAKAWAARARGDSPPGQLPFPGTEK
jgi:hypothetical protein